MSLLIKGATTFLALTDTPASFAGEAGKAALVNTGENALEFGAVQEADIAPVFDDTIIYGPAAKNDNWEDLDCGVGQALVYFDVELNAAAALATRALFRPNGETIQLTADGVHRASFNNTRKAYALCITDSAGLVEWRNNSVANSTVRRRAYWPMAPAERVGLYLPGAGTFPAFSDWQLGKANALVLVMFEKTAGHIYFRCRGEPIATGQSGCSWSSGPGAGFGGLLLLKTDADGLVEGQWGGDMNIWRLSYLKRFTEYGNQAFGVGVNPPAAYTDLDCGMGRGILYNSLECTAGGVNIDVSHRRNGEALNVYEQCFMVGGVITNPQICYNFVLVDENGIVEWKGNNASTVTLRRLAACR
jgi:hypothetical protein